MRLLLVEDEKKLAESLQAILQKNHYQTDIVFEGEEGLDYALTEVYDIIILDIMLPGKTGLEILKVLRQQGILTPVLLLTAKNMPDDKISGLDYGADDYMTKPFDPNELMARLRAMLRRANKQVDVNLLSFYGISYHLANYELSCNDKVLRLTQKEGDLLAYLMQNSDSIISKEQIISKIWGMDSSAEHNHVEVYISFLRKKLAGMNAKAKIQTVRGVGYQLLSTGESE